ncbi:MAG: calcium-binding protein, partial [Selenomonadaceae bacterium]|nr:calcium-binding protein [Selenomonadaceae bacterium]
TTWINGVYSIRGSAGLTTITGSDKDDTIISGTGRTTINARGGNDYISLTSARALVNYESGDGNDLITGFNANSTLNLSGEDFTSVTSGDDVILSVGDEKITLAGAASLNALNIVGNFGNTGIEIDNSADHTIVTGTAYNDTIRNYGRRVTVRGLAGDDYLVNMIDSSVTAASAVANLFEGGDGNDTIFSYHSYQPTLSGGNGNDRIIVNQGHMNYIDGGNGNDSILGRTTDNQDSADWAMGGYATLLGGDGNDYIDPFYTNNSTISGGAGNDTIIMMGANSTLNGGAGDDQISLGTSDSVNVRINYAAGDGNDLIQGFDDKATLAIGGSYSTKKSGDNVIVTVGKGKITLTGAASLEAVNVVSNLLTVDNKNKSSVTVGAYVKTIDASARAKAVKITGNALDNLIVGGSGNDKLYGKAGDDSLWGGKGNDSLWGGTGDDTFIYQAGEGTDKIFDYQSGDMLKILNGKFSKSKFSGGTLSLTISGGGQIIFDNVTTSTNFNING